MSTTYPFRLRVLALGLLIVLLASLTGCNVFGDDPAAYRHETPSEYYLYIPKNAKDSAETRIFVGIHGEGGSGRDCWSDWQSYAKKEGFVLICPSLADQNGGWMQDQGEAKVRDILNAVLGEHKYNPKVYIAGFSAGAQFVQGFAMNYPNNTAGVAVLSAANYYGLNGASKNIPYLVMIGEQDNADAVTGAQNLKVALENGGYKFQFLLEPGTGHTLTGDAKDMTITQFKEAIK